MKAARISIEETPYQDQDGRGLYDVILEPVTGGPFRQTRVSTFSGACKVALDRYSDKRYDIINYPPTFVNL